MAKLRVLVIGAGASGLPAIKCCLDQGLEPVCLERSGDIGGLWNYENSLATGDRMASVMKSTIINSSKEMMSYSDFPIPADYANFMHNKYVLQYLRLYADAFGLRQHIQLHTEVLRLKPAGDFPETGQWQALIRNLQTSVERTEIFDAVMVCTGHHADKYMAHFEGEEDFKGTRVHSHDFRDTRGYDGKRVVVIGIGNSGGDVAVELSHICDQVYLSTRRGSWVVNRLWDNGLPIDFLMYRRFNSLLARLVPRFVRNTFLERQLNARFDHVLYGLKPDHPFDAQHPMINDNLPNAIASGRVVIKPNVRRLTENGVEFEDGSVVDNIDVVIYATGYVFGFPFIDHKALTVVKNEVNLFKFVFSPDIRPSTLAIIGCCQVLGALFPVSELQSRWVVSVFKGETALPSSEQMWNDIKLKREEMLRRYYASQRHTIQTDYRQYMDEIAEFVGCKPNLLRLLLSDPLLAFHVYFGALTSYQFRIMGPGAWPAARDTILTTWERVQKPFRTRKVKKSSRSAAKFGIVLFSIAVFLFALFTARLF